MKRLIQRFPSTFCILVAGLLFVATQAYTHKLHADNVALFQRFLAEDTAKIELSRANETRALRQRRHDAIMRIKSDATPEENAALTAELLDLAQGTDR